MNDLQIFNNQEFGQIRMTEIDGKIYAASTDIAKFLGYSNTHKAIRDHCKGVTKRSVLTNGGEQLINFIPEGDIYRLIVKSHLPQAEKLEKWVFDEILPTIRKHGAYINPEKIEEILTNPDIIIQLATNWKEEKAKRIIVETENKILSQETLTWTNRKTIEALIKKLGGKTGYSESWVTYKKELLYKHSINLNSRITKWRNDKGRKTGPKTLDMIHDDELGLALSTALSMCKVHKVDTSEIINKFSEFDNIDLVPSNKAIKYNV